MRSDQSRRIWCLLISPTHSSCVYFRAEKAVNEALENKPEPYLLALAQFATSADTEVVCIISCVK